MSYQQLTQEQRYHIYERKHEGVSLRTIAVEIGVAPSTVSREVRRNRGQRGYRPCQAHQTALERRQIPRRPITFTARVRALVERKLKLDWSPSQIVGWLERNGLPSVSHERIYAHVWQDKREGGTLYHHLRHGNRKYRKRYGKRDSRGRIPNQTSIEQRPAVVERRNRSGDWEVDTVLGKQARHAVVSAVERDSRYTVLTKVPNRLAETLSKALVKGLKPHEVKTITSDNGREFAGHAEIAEALDADFYFAHPYHSWERGTNENTNGLIRQYLPKGRSLDNVTQKELRFIMDRLNHRPRECLGFKTPAEVHFSKQNKRKKT